MALIFRLCLAFFLTTALISKSYAFDIGIKGAEIKGANYDPALIRNSSYIREGKILYKVSLSTGGTATLSAGVRATWRGSKIIKAARTILKFGKANLVGLVAFTALDYLIDKSGLLSDDGGKTYKKLDNSLTITGAIGRIKYTISPELNDLAWYDDVLGACGYASTFYINNKSPNDYYRAVYKGAIYHDSRPDYHAKFDGMPMGECYYITVRDGVEHYISGWYSFDTCKLDDTCVAGVNYDVNKSTRPLTDADIDNFDFNRWEPKQSDAKILEPYIETMPPDEVEITTQPAPVTLPKKITTKTNPDGTTTVTETETTVKTELVPDGRGGFKTRTTETQKNIDYTNGQKTGETSTETVTDNTTDTQVQPDPAFDSTNPPKSDKSDIPTDCDFMPTVCEWLHWTKEEPDFSETDYSQFKRDDNIQLREYKISVGSASCPSRSLSFSFGSYAFDFTFICRFAAGLRLFLLAGAYYLSIRILIRAF